MSQIVAVKLDVGGEAVNGIWQSVLWIPFMAVASAENTFFKVFLSNVNAVSRL